MIEYYNSHQAEDNHNRKYNQGLQKMFGHRKQLYHKEEKPMRKSLGFDLVSRAGDVPVLRTYTHEADVPHDIPQRMADVSWIRERMPTPCTRDIKELAVEGVARSRDNLASCPWSLNLPTRRA